MLGQTTKKEMNKVIEHKEKLLRYDREFTKRTVVYDDQMDYFSNTKSTWLDEKERMEAKNLDEIEREELRKGPKLNVIF